MKNAAIGFLLVAAAYMYITEKNQVWSGFLYPDSGNLNSHLPIGPFDTLETCRDAATANLVSLNAEYTGTYECGLNCEYSTNMQMNVCEETTR